MKKFSNNDSIFGKRGNLHNFKEIYMVNDANDNEECSLYFCRLRRNVYSFLIQHFKNGEFVSQQIFTIKNADLKFVVRGRYFDGQDSNGFMIHLEFEDSNVARTVFEQIVAVVTNKWR